ncbi:hypothetical protein DSECCO2_609370 [anaerobic digester metagenome]
MQRHCLGQRRHIQMLHTEVVDEFHGLVEFEPRLHLAAHGVEAGAGVAKDGDGSIATDPAQRRFEFGGLARGVVVHSLGFERQAAAQFLHAFGEDDVEAGLGQNGHGGLEKAALVRVQGSGAHGTRGAARKIDHLPAHAPDGVAQADAGRGLGGVRRPEGHDSARDPAQRMGHGGHGARPKQPVDGVGEPQPLPCKTRDQTIVVRDKAADFTAARRGFAAAVVLGENAGVHADRADRGAQPVCGACLVAEVCVVLVEGVVFRLVALGRDPGHVALKGDALARRGGDVSRGAHGLAVAAFDAGVDKRVHLRQRLQVFHVHLRIVGEDDAGIEQVVRVEGGLEAAHQGVGGPAPLHLHEGGHVAARAVLALERPVVAPDDHLRHFVDEVPVVGHGLRIREIRAEDEMQVAFQGVAENDALGEAVPGHEMLQLHRALGQAFDGEDHVFDDDRAAGLARAADGGEKPAPDVPELFVVVLVVHEKERKHRFDASDAGKRPVDAGEQLGLVRAAHLDQDGGGVFTQFLEVGGHAGLVLDAAQRRPVHELHGGHGAGFQRHGRAAGVGDGRVDHERGSLEGVLDHRAVGDLGDERQGALGADDEVEQDVERVLEIHEGVDAVAGGVFDLELAADAFGERRIGQDFRADGSQFRQERGVGHGEACPGNRVGGVQAVAVDEDELCRFHGLVAVFRGAAAHARGVVGGDAADHAGADGGRVRADLAAVRGQGDIGVRADDARFDADAPRPGVDAQAPEIAG